VDLKVVAYTVQQLLQVGQAQYVPVDVQLYVMVIQTPAVIHAQQDLLL
jgi:hypothetical protein